MDCAGACLQWGMRVRKYRQEIERAWAVGAGIVVLGGGGFVVRYGPQTHLLGFCNDIKPTT